MFQLKHFFPIEQSLCFDIEIMMNKIRGSGRIYWGKIALYWKKCMQKKTGFCIVPISACPVPIAQGLLTGVSIPDQGMDLITEQLKIVWTLAMINTN